MAKPHNHKSSSSPGGRTNCASCVVATIFLIFIVIIVLIVFFTLFKPQEPKIWVNAIQLPTFSLTNGTVSFTFSQYLSVKNPNRAVFTHYDSTLQLLYSGNQVGFMFVPAGKISSGRTEYMAATFSVQSFPLSPDGTMPPPTVDANAARGLRVVPTMELESRIEMAGRVRVLHFFTHHVRARAWCRAAISVNDGSVLGFHC